MKRTVKSLKSKDKAKKFAWVVRGGRRKTQAKLPVGCAGCK